MNEGTKSASETELPVASGGSHEPNTRIGRKSKRMQEIIQTATTLMFSTEQQQFISKLVTKIVHAKKSQVDADGHTGATSSGRANLEKPAKGLLKSNVQGLHEEKQVRQSSRKMRRISSGQLRITHRQVCL